MPAEHNLPRVEQWRRHQQSNPQQFPPSPSVQHNTHVPSLPNHVIPGSPHRSNNSSSSKHSEISLSIANGKTRINIALLESAHVTIVRDRDADKQDSSRASAPSDRNSPGFRHITPRAGTRSTNGLGLLNVSGLSSTPFSPVRTRESPPADRRAHFVPKTKPTVPPPKTHSPGQIRNSSPTFRTAPGVIPLSRASDAAAKLEEEKMKKGEEKKRAAQNARTRKAADLFWKEQALRREFESQSKNEEVLQARKKALMKERKALFNEI